MRQEGLGVAGGDFSACHGKVSVGLHGSDALQHTALHVTVTSLPKPSPSRVPSGAGALPGGDGESGRQGTTLGMTGGREENSKELCLREERQGNMEQ